ncbi:MAG: hypothetical protein IPL46_30595 [Saprospiraceae bacterium]|nr:hypothetical protein [Saprospiraceae bacterium]
MKLNDFKYIALFILASTFVHAQQIDPTTNYMPSPDAAGLGKYGDVSVGYHTGSAGISIPLI